MINNSVSLSLKFGVDSSGSTLMNYFSGFLAEKFNAISSSGNFIYEFLDKKVKSEQVNEGINSLFANYTTNVMREFTEKSIQKSLEYSEILGGLEKLKVDTHNLVDAPSIHAIEAAEYFVVNYIAKYGLQSPHVNVLDDGELVFYWNDSAKLIDLTVEDDETYSFYAKRKDEKKGFKGNYNYRVLPPVEFMEMIK